MARYKFPGVTPLLTARAMLTFKTYLDEIEGKGRGGEGEGEILDVASPSISCSKLWRRVSLLRMEVNVRPDDIINS